MSELNTYYIPTRSGNSCLCYLKSEADKFISDLEERHKKEVGQLLIEIAELERNVDNWTDSYEISRKINAELEVENRKLKERFIELQDTAIELDKQLTETRKQLRHQKYKLCLAMARMCEERSARYDVLQERHDLDWGREIEFYYRWYKRWLEFAEQFKEATK